MTAIVCFNTSLAGAVFLADSRLSYPAPSGQIVSVRDVCQKLFIPNAWSVLGFAGDLCLGNDLAGAFFTELKEAKWTKDHWLGDDAAIKKLVTETIAAHPSLGSGHSTCDSRPAGILIAYVGLVRFNKEDGSLDHYQLGTMTVAVLSDGTIERQGIGAAVLGEGGQLIQPKLTLELITQIANAASPESQALLALNATRVFVNEVNARSVGEPFQVAHLSAKGVLLVPYFYWANVTNRFGTYVAMRIEDGDWVQDHRPSGRVLRFKRPYQILNQELDEGAWPLGKNEMFDPRRALYNTSPGVIRAPNPNLIYAVYDPNNVPASIMASWGSEPPPLLTWAQPGEPAAYPG